MVKENVRIINVAFGADTDPIIVDLAAATNGLTYNIPNDGA
jgi:hypothetical protein